VLGHEKSAGVRALLRRLDADPYRDAVWDAVLAGDQAKVAALANEEAALAQPPGFAVFLGDSRAIPVERRRQVLEAALSERPAYLHLLMTMGDTYPAGQKDQPGEPVRWYQAAVAAAPDNLAALHNLGTALQDRGDEAGAIACYHKAIALSPENPRPYANLGFALDQAGKGGEAIDAWRRSVALDPAQPNVWFWLARGEQNRGRVDEAATAYRKVAELYPAAERRAWVARWFLRFVAVLRGEERPADHAERLMIAEIAHGQRRYALAAGLAAEALAGDPKRGDDLRAGHRYNAACSAAMAEAGAGVDEAPLDGAAKARLRGQAFDWLRADLALWSRRLEAGDAADRAAVQRIMLHWQEDADLSGIREQAALAKLPAHEQAAFARLWADVAALRKKAEAPATREGQK
jgi:tetratricopeptide (TPR) repeat protein